MMDEEGSVVTPLPDDLIAPSEAVVTPKPPTEVERELETKYKLLRRAKGLDLDEG